MDRSTCSKLFLSFSPSLDSNYNKSGSGLPGTWMESGFVMTTQTSPSISQRRLDASLNFGFRSPASTPSWRRTATAPPKVSDSLMCKVVRAFQ